MRVTERQKILDRIAAVTVPLVLDFVAIFGRSRFHACHGNTRGVFVRVRVPMVTKLGIRATCKGESDQRPGDQ